MRTPDRGGRLRPGRRRSTPPSAPAPAGTTAQRLTALEAAAAGLSSGAEPAVALTDLLAHAARALPGAALLLAVTPAGGEAVLSRAVGLPEEQVAGLAAVLVSGSAPAAGAVVVDVVSGRRWHGRVAALPGPAATAAASAEAGPDADPDPLAGAGGVLAAYAGLVAAVLERWTAGEEARREAARAETLLTLAAALAAAPNATAVCAAAAEALPAVVGCDRIGLLLWETGAGRLRAVAGQTSPEGLPLELYAEETPELVGMLTDRRPRVLRWETCSPAMRDLLGAGGVTDALAVPLMAGGAFLGVVTAAWPAGSAPAAPEGEQLDRLRGAADQVAVALDRLRLADSLHHQATHDPLTGLPNRELLRQRLESALTTVRADQHVGVLCCDLDGFAAVNDEHGGQAGDELLRQVAARLRAAVRPGDTIARLGADEFAVVLPGLGAAADVEAVLARVRACFTEPFRLARRPVPVGCAVGVAVHSGEWGVADDLLRAARADRR
ncbi:sensor domain-containing diguanylate cyclase [Trujillonella endophytica]|uniref:Diguanylate cyclase (GGDEF) domain-containing protein n=1 Tax=Trujillonella endophytica TaxID=673521 RepID=A0A1H8UDA5_9ACTN|nr:sensor domain-containing diguanylate cyclase [Trujillella endophytica]SEP01209.1 diguanylate cyclase (GGDEF) domain-containing protein [Trujillella endophytica]